MPHKGARYDARGARMTLEKRYTYTIFKDNDFICGQWIFMDNVYGYFYCIITIFMDDDFSGGGAKCFLFS